MTPPGNKSYTGSGKFSTLRKLFAKRNARPSLPIQYPEEKSENSAISNVPITARDPTLTLRTIESVLLASAELDALTTHRQALDSLARKYKDALVKVHKRKATNDRQDLTAKDEKLFCRFLKPITDAEQHAFNVTWELFSVLRRTVGSDVMMAAERDRKNGTRALVYLLLKLGLEQEYRSPASNDQKQLFEKVAKLCTQFINECKTDAKDDAPNGVTREETAKDDTPQDDTAQDDTPEDDTPEGDPPKDDAPKAGPSKTDAPENDAPKDDAPKDDAPKDDAPKDDAPKDDAPKDDAPKDDAPKDDAPKHDAPMDDAPDHDAPNKAGENILIVAGQFLLLELKPQTADALGNTQKQILAEITKLCIDFLNSSNDGEKPEMDDSYLALEEIRCLASSINKRLAYILAKVEMKPTNQRQELIRLVNSNLNHFMEECRKELKEVEEQVEKKVAKKVKKKVEKSEITGSPQSSKELETQTYESSEAKQA